MSFQVHVDTILWWGSVKRGHSAGPTKDQSSDEMPAPKNKKELQAFLGIINYLSKFSPDMSVVCKLLRKLTSSKAMWMWDTSYQQWYQKAKLLIKVEMFMKFYDDTRPLYLKIDTSRIGLWEALLKLRDNTDCQKGTRQYNPVTYCICKQKFNGCWAEVW